MASFTFIRWISIELFKDSVRTLNGLILEKHRSCRSVWRSPYLCWSTKPGELKSSRNLENLNFGLYLLKFAVLTKDDKTFLLNTVKKLEISVKFLIECIFSRCGACKQLKNSFNTSPKRKEFIQLTRKFVMVNLEVYFLACYPFIPTFLGRRRTWRRQICTRWSIHSTALFHEGRGRSSCH